MKLVLAALIGLAAALDFTECIHTGDLSPPCLKLIASKVLGTVLVVFSTIVKLPQIIKIVQAKSVEGLSALSFYIELLSFGLMSAYSYHNGQPISTYGESVTIFFQCGIQVVLLWIYGKFSAGHIRSVIFAFLAVFLTLGSGFIPESVWKLVIMTQFPFLIIVKGSQILTNFTQGSTGQLSFITNFLNFGGTSVRIFTTLVEVADPLLLLNYGLATLLNFTLVFQILFYWNQKMPGTKKE